MFWLRISVQVNHGSMLVFHSKTGSVSFTVELNDGRIVNRQLDQLREDSAAINSHDQPHCSALVKILQYFMCFLFLYNTLHKSHAWMSMV